MNIGIISGKIVSKIEFKFIYHQTKNKKNNHISIATFYLELENKSIIKTIAYDENADYIYKNKNEYFYVEGRILVDFFEIESIN